MWRILNFYVIGSSNSFHKIISEMVVLTEREKTNVACADFAVN
jgi:hypothetical protein